ncbi:MAG: ATP-binding protein [Acidimicrobiales bacterium]|nr:ATP-binding protein [Acidimicrobiales bacterium]MXX43937.1 ATP-binding protein [Acidimicrobiales bacterium]MYB82355.1 ATP-binding protein [Acidimicrobiales bacterium]MYD35307.1 ATP-binding protein [Acidimicrobiales bacterium]MYI10385.1 ATP-binding protein [Acidimicrobiales bacterium]
MSSEYRYRLADQLLSECLAELPAVMLVGPRACGKTTTAARHAATVLRLDTEQGSAALRADPDAALRDREEPVLIDEWQEFPAVMGAVKRAVDAERRPGRFLITGSARSNTDERLWPATGRVVMVPMHPLTVAESLGRSPRPFIDRVTAGETLRGDDPPLDLADYLGFALRGGFPEPALELGETGAQRWLASYADQVALRDARSHGQSPDSARLRRYLEALAINSARTPQEKTLCDAAGIDRRTAQAYEQLLGDLVVTDHLSAWSTNRLKRLSRTPKRYLVDSGLLAAILEADRDDALGDGAMLGSLIDTFVVAQLRAEAPAAARYRLSHLRDQNGRREIDVIAELSRGRLIGIEIKAAAGVRRSDARHLVWLRDSIGESFIAGVVLHTGPDTFELDDRIVAAPISTLWAQPHMSS